jgi:DNA (cytosine-5)-methyltransferase 1
MIKVGTDFSGIGSPEAALKRLKIPHHNIFACDIDKYAEKSFLELNNPDKFYRDITTRDYKEVPKLDLYVAGFPCQSFSLAGKRKGFDETRGTLFFNVAEFIKINQPECFILENVKGLLSHDSGKTFQTITDVLTNGGGTLNGQMGMDSIEDGLGYHVYTKVLNTKDYGIPQNRERIFIVGFKNWREFRFPKELPLDITLKDLLEGDVNEKYYLSENRINTLKTKDRSIGFTDVDTKKIANCLIASYHKSPTDGEYIKVHSLYPRSSKTGKGGTGHLSKEDGTTYCLDTGNNQAIEVKQLNQSKESGGKQPYQQNRVYDINGLAPCLDTGSERRNINTNRIRRLTPLECWRLQGFSDEEFYKAQKVNSDTQLYKQAGNSITVNVMVEIFKKIYLK